MEHSKGKKHFLACLMAAGLMLGGCAFLGQRATPVQTVGDRTNTPTQAQTTTPTAALDETVLDGLEIELTPSSVELTDQTWPQELDSSNQPELLPLWAIEDERSLIWPRDPVTSDQSQSIALLTTEDEPSIEYDDVHATEDFAGSDPQSASLYPGEEDSDLWERIRQGFAFPAGQHRRIDGEAKWFSRNQDYLDRVAEHARPYLHYIVSQVEKRGLPTEIVLLPVVESAFQPYAYSSGHAAGIWQFIPATGRRFGLKLNWWYDGRRDIVASTRAALDYLEYLHDYFDGDWLLALAGYNAGEGTVLKAMRYNRRRRRPTDFWSLRLPRETKQYVPRLLALRDIVAAPEKMGISLRPILDEPYLTSVDIDSQLDLATAAKLADMDLEELHQLNPGFNRWATAPDGPHHLLLPLDKAERFADEVAQLPPELRVQWVRHRVRRGETLGGIARRYRTTVRVLRQLNNLRGNLIRAGHYLVIPIPARAGGSQQIANLDIAANGDNSIHTVRSGESLWLLSRRYGTTVRELCHWNNISPRALLQPGQRIIVVYGPSSSIIPASLHTLTVPGTVAK
ncbi:MAG: LysM peptidoglycan-binding domain-containing protein, partial [Candidatus Tectomicrobia bacterium]